MIRNVLLRPPYLQTATQNMYTQPCLERDQNPWWIPCSKVPDHTCLSERMANVIGRYDNLLCNHQSSVTMYNLSLGFPREQPLFPEITLRSFHLHSSFHPQTTFKITVQSILWPVFMKFHLPCEILRSHSGAVEDSVFWGVTSCRKAVTDVSRERTATTVRA